MAKKSKKLTPTKDYRLEIVTSEEKAKEILKLVLAIEEMGGVKLKLDSCDVNLKGDDSILRHQTTNIELHPDGYEVNNWLAGFLDAENKITKLVESAKNFCELYCDVKECNELDESFSKFKESLEKVIKKR